MREMAITLKLLIWHMLERTIRLAPIQINLSHSNHPNHLTYPNHHNHLNPLNHTNPLNRVAMICMSSLRF